LQGYNAQKASFSRTIHVKQIGHAIYHLDGFNEDYLITLPALHIEGLIYGSPFVELNKSSTITSTSGYIAKIDYSGKGWMSGKKNSFSATLAKLGAEKSPLYTIEGQWNENFSIKEGSGGKTHKVIDTYTASQTPITKLQVAPVEQQDPRESKRAWKMVADGIRRGDMDTVSAQKSKIENEQREMRKKEKEEGREWQRTFFTAVPNDPLFDQLAKSTGEKIEADKTGGIWRFDPKKAQAAKAPY
jgi:hypothetical protein